MALAPGLEAAFRYTVTGADTAAAVGSGEVPVLATPRVVALAERATVAAVAAVAGALEAGATTVGTGVELEHLAPARSGPTWRSTPCWTCVPAFSQRSRSAL